MSKQPRQPKRLCRLPSMTADGWREMFDWLERAAEHYLDAARTTKGMLRGADLPQLQAQLEYQLAAYSVVGDLRSRLSHEHARWRRINEPDQPVA